MVRIGLLPKIEAILTGFCAMFVLGLIFWDKLPRSIAKGEASGDSGRVDNGRLNFDLDRRFNLKVQPLS